MYKNIQDQLRQKEREAHLEETKNFSSKIQQLFKKANENKTEQVVERKQLDSSLVNTFEYKINGLQRAIKEAYARLQIGKYDGFVDIISSYNDICIYLKNIVKYSTLNQTYKVGIDDEMKKVVPALTDIDIYSSSIKKYNVPELKQIINNINNKTYQTIGASASVGFKRVMIDREEFIQKLKSQYSFISTNKHFVKDKKERKILDKYETELEELMRKAPRWKFDRATKQEELKKEYDNLDNIVEITNNIIEPYLQQYKKTDGQKEQQKQLEKQRQLDQARKALMESKQSVANQISVLEGKIKKEKKKKQKDALKDQLDELQNNLNMIEVEEKKMKVIITKLPEQNLIMGEEKTPTDKGTVNLELNPPNPDNSQQIASDIVRQIIDKATKKTPSITLQTGSKDDNDRTLYDKLIEAVRNDDQIGMLALEASKFIKPFFEQQIKEVLKTIPQLRGFDKDSLINTMEQRNVEAFTIRHGSYNTFANGSLKERHLVLYGNSDVLGHHLYDDAVKDTMAEWKSQHGDISDDRDTFNQIFQKSKKLILDNLHKYIQQGKDLSAEIKNTLVSDIVKVIEQQNAEKDEKVPEQNDEFFIENITQMKNRLLQSNPWLSEVNSNIMYSDFMAYAGNKRKEGLNFDTSQKWKIFKNFNDR